MVCNTDQKRKVGEKWLGLCMEQFGLLTVNIRDNQVAFHCLTRPFPPPLLPSPTQHLHHAVQHFAMTIAADFIREDPQIYTPSTPCKFSPSLPHTPSRSSPLSARPQTTISGMFKPKMLPSPPSSPPDFLVPKRLFKPVPIFTSHEKGREARRDLFLKKVRSKREDKVIKSRGGEEEVCLYTTSLEFGKCNTNC